MKKTREMVRLGKKERLQHCRKRVFIRNCTFAGIVVETEEEKQSLLAKNHKRIVLVNCSSICNMRPITENLKQFQNQGDYMAIINKKGQKQWKLNSSELPFSCPIFPQFKPGNGFDTCFYAQQRRIKTHIVY